MHDRNRDVESIDGGLFRQGDASHEAPHERSGVVGDRQSWDSLNRVKSLAGRDGLASGQLQYHRVGGKHIEATANRVGYRAPIICTPHELME